jgi:hypothetical protein
LHVKRKKRKKLLVETEKFAFFGDSISADGAISKEELLAKFETLKKEIQLK